MATNFPASLDSLTNPTSSDSLNSPSHSAQHANVNDAVEALQAKVGADSSAVTSSLDYKVAQLEALGTATAFTPSWTNFTPGNATESWYYVVVNDLLIVQGRTVLGSTSVMGFAPRFAFPVGTQVAPSATASGSTIYEDAGADLYTGFVDINSSEFRLWVNRADATFVKRDYVASTAPMTWATGDILWAEAMAVIS